MIFIIPKHLEKRFKQMMFENDWDTIEMGLPGGSQRDEVTTGFIRETINKDLRWKIWERDDFTCKKCGSRQDLHIDHINPVSKGGKTTEDNLQTLCARCNRKKGSKYE